jgi:hypothetical protein
MLNRKEFLTGIVGVIVTLFVVLAGATTHKAVQERAAAYPPTTRATAIRCR